MCNEKDTLNSGCFLWHWWYTVIKVSVYFKKTWWADKGHTLHNHVTDLMSLWQDWHDGQIKVIHYMIMLLIWCHCDMIERYQCTAGKFWTEKRTLTDTWYTKFTNNNVLCDSWLLKLPEWWLDYKHSNECSLNKSLRTKLCHN